MKTEYNRDNVLKHSFIDLGLPEQAKQLQGWLSNFVNASELKTVEEVMQILSAIKRKPSETAGKVSVHNVYASFFAGHDKPVRKPLDVKPEDQSTNEKKPGPKNP